MPLAAGSSDKAAHANIREMMHSFDRTGRVGTSRPKSRKKAQKQIVAIALSEQRKSLAEGR